MKKVFSSQDNTQVELLKNMLANVGILCEERNADVSRVWPAPSFHAELWVTDENYPRAAELVASLQGPVVSSGSAWTCPQCGERIEAQFSSCWKCGTEREQLA